MTPTECPKSPIGARRRTRHPRKINDHKAPRPNPRESGTSQVGHSVGFMGEASGGEDHAAAMSEVVILQ
jgi:hypothetical protein